MKKICVLSLLLVMSAFVFSCSKVQKSAQSGPREIVYWSHYGHAPAIVQAWADTANAALQKLGYTDVTCRAEIIEYSGYETKYLTAFASGSGPDIFLPSRRNLPKAGELIR